MKQDEDNYDATEIFKFFIAFYKSNFTFHYLQALGSVNNYTFHHSFKKERYSFKDYENNIRCDQIF